MFGFFRRQPKTQPPPIADQRDGEDWQPGDLALCISGAFLPPSLYDPRVGDLLRVTHVIDAVADFGFEVRMIALTFESKPADTGWQSTAFRKVRPEIKAAEDEFVVGLREHLGRREPV